MAMSPAAVHAEAVAAGLGREAAAVATAVAWAESGLRPDAVGDEDLEDERWGPSIGLWQVRSLRANTGTGLPRDADRLKDPAFNAAAMAAISGDGSDFEPWTMWRNGGYLEYVDAVRAAVEEEPMETWLPGARRVVPNSAGASPFIGCAWKVCLHTTEGGGNWDGATSYHGSQSYPHFEVQDGVPITQFFPIDVASRALYNAPGGYETNRANVVQVEIAGWAVDSQNLTDDVLDKLAAIIRFVHDQTGMAMDFPLAFRPPFTVGYRLEGQDIYDCEGVVGHQHFGEGNDHSDPGLIPVLRLQARLGTQPQPEGDPRMLSFRYVFDDVDWVFDGPSRLFFHTDDTDQITQVLDAIKFPALGRVSAATHRRYSELATKAGFTG